MNYVWEAVIQADKEGISRDHLRFVPTRAGSPYTEISLEIIKTVMGTIEVKFARY